MNIFDLIIIIAVVIWFSVSLFLIFGRKNKGGCCGDCKACASGQKNAAHRHSSQ